MDLEKLGNTVLELEQNSKQLKSFIEVYAEISNLKKDLANNAALLQSTSNEVKYINKKLSSQLNSYTEQLGKIDSFLVKRIEEIYKDNKSFQKELESLLTSKLNSNKTDIEGTIINQSRQSQIVFENAMVANFNKLEEKIKNNYETQTNLLNNLKTLAYVAIGISSATGVGVFALIFK